MSAISNNISLIVQNYNASARRFKVIADPEGGTPTVQKVNAFVAFFRFFCFWKDYASPLRDAINTTIDSLEEDAEIDDREKIDLQKYHRYLKNAESAPLFEELNRGEGLKTSAVDGTKHKTWKYTNKEEALEGMKTQPVMHKGRYYYKDNEANHGREAMSIFFDTQGKRFLRFFFPRVDKLKYFSQKEQPTDIYKRDTPIAESEKGKVQNIGHATLLFQMKGLNVLTDPVFGDLNPLLYPRKTEPGLTPEELPVIDVVLISHNHRDHVDAKSMKKLLPHQPLLLVPKGDKNLFEDMGFTRVQEREWWETITVSTKAQSFEFYALPSRHWSGRGPFDAHESLTCSWAFHPTDGDRAVYFSGDSANMPDETMAEIKEFLPMPITADFEPAGPNHRRSDMESTHKSAVDSAIAHFNFADSTEKHVTTYLIHHNTYELGTDRFNEAKFILDDVISGVENNADNLPDFIQEGVDTLNARKDKKRVLRHLKKRIVLPKIGERRSFKI